MATEREKAISALHLSGKAIVNDAKVAAKNYGGSEDSAFTRIHNDRMRTASRAAAILKRIDAGVKTTTKTVNKLYRPSSDK
jgi:hypothetical protein